MARTAACNRAISAEDNFCVSATGESRAACRISSE
jgi:hypothetical protein